ncbi:hypothetical protein [Pontibacter roseus]
MFIKSKITATFYMLQKRQAQNKPALFVTCKMCD